MALYYSSGTRPQDLGKFRGSRRPGVQHDEKMSYEGYRFELLSVQSTSPVNKFLYHVSIYHSTNLRLSYLRDFASPSQAFAAAKKWVQEREITNKHKRDSRR